MYLKDIEGESVFSLVARHHAASPYNSLRERNRALFGRPEIKLNPQLPCSLSMISQKTGIPTNYLLNHGTIYPLVSATLNDKKDKDALSQAMLSNCGTSVMALSRLVSSRLKFGNSIKYCPECLTEDESQYGCGIWHTNHQLAGVTVCPRHSIWLLNISLDADGLNKRIEPPPSQFVGFKPSPEPPPIAATKLSQYLSELYSLTQDDSMLALSAPHMAWLNEGHYLTSEKRIRLEKLSREFNHYWSALFKLGVLPNELSDISYVRNLVKPDRNMHYIKHALLGMIFTGSPKEYYSKPAALDTTPAPIQNNAQPTDDADKVATLLKKELSLRSVAVATGHSVGYVSKVAAQRGIPFQHRYKKLSDDMVSKIIRMAYRGIHRKQIAKECGVGIECVEQKIEGQKGLSEWRRKLRRFESRNRHRQSLKDYKKTHPGCSRNEIRKKTSDYNWLFRHDKEWLLQHLPRKIKRRFYTLTNWADRDAALATRIQLEITSATSLSDIDRQLIGSPSIRKNKGRLPKAYALALKLISECSTSKTLRLS